MIALADSKLESSPAVRRLASLAKLDRTALDALGAALKQRVRYRARTELQSEGKAIGDPRIVVAGWAARVRMVADGRQQLLSFLLPGDVIGLCYQPCPVAHTTIVALTEVELVRAPLRLPQLAEAYELSRAHDEAYLLDQIARLGLLHASDRILHLLLEFHERLTRNGMAEGASFDMPLTQERLADAVGLSAVHVNRVLQMARKTGDLCWGGRRVTLHDPAALARRVGRNPVRVSGALAN